MALNTEKTVREYAVETPGATRVDDYTAPADGCISYRALYGALEEFEADLHQHIHLENNVLFPRAAVLEKGLSGGM